MNSLSKRALSDSPAVRHWREKVPPIFDALCPISMDTGLSEKQRSAITVFLL